MIAAIFTELLAIVTGIIGAIAQGFEDIIPIFWSGTALTLIGSLILIPAGAGIVALVWAFITKLFKFRIGK